MIDYLPQSTAADIMWEMFLPLDSFCESNGGHLVTTVHDSFLMEFPRERIDKWLLSGLRSILEREFPKVGTHLRVPVVLKIGSSWGQMEPLPPSLALAT
jgi:DNA polymerase I-like protein with 3'-5' exonuclease and polymerase domains